MVDAALLPTATEARRPRLSPLNQRRWKHFKANKRGYWSLWIFLILLVAALAGLAFFAANDPIDLRGLVPQQQQQVYRPKGLRALKRLFQTVKANY